MKFGQIIEYNMRNIFLEKSYTKCGGEVPDPFLAKQNWVYLWINSLKFYTVYFRWILSWGLSKYIETKLQTTCFSLLLSMFFKKRGLIFQKYFSCYSLLIDHVSFPGCFYFLRYWEICVLQLFVNQVVTWILKLTLSF